MKLEYVYKPTRFFLITFLGTWIPGFIAAYLSYQPDMQGIQFILMILGLLAPCIAALGMIYGSKNKALIKDFWHRLRPDTIKLRYLPIILLLMPTVLFVATLISLLLGQSVDQLTLAHELKVMKGWSIFSLVIPFFLAPLLEELGWRGYGVDSLRAHFNLFTTSLLFALLWGLWHLPLFFINGFYNHELWNLSIVYVINYFVSLFPVALLSNWIYYKNCRSIAAAILFHSMINLSAILFQTEQFTKCIVTILLCVISIIVIITNKKFFFNTSVEDTTSC